VRIVRHYKQRVTNLPADNKLSCDADGHITGISILAEDYQARLRFAALCSFDICRFCAHTQNVLTTFRNASGFRTNRLLNLTIDMKVYGWLCSSLCV
jgi:hypothetical protein